MTQKKRNKWLVASVRVTVLWLGSLLFFAALVPLVALGPALTSASWATILNEFRNILSVLSFAFVWMYFAWWLAPRWALMAFGTGLGFLAIWFLTWLLPWRRWLHLPPPRTGPNASSQVD